MSNLSDLHENEPAGRHVFIGKLVLTQRQNETRNVFRDLRFLSTFLGVRITLSLVEHIPNLRLILAYSFNHTDRSG